MQKRLAAPRAAERRYVGALAGAMRKMHEDAMTWLRPKLPQIAKKPEARHDASTHLGNEFEAEVDSLVATLAASVSPSFDALAEGVATNNARALRGLGLDIRGTLGATLDHLRDWNVNLMRKAGRAYAEDVAGVLSDPQNWGLRAEELAALVEDRASVSESRAELIARDQTSKLNSAISQHRQQSAGITSYTWSGSLDERERETHLANEGKVFDWASPPSETGHPGDDIQCRCVAVPILPEDGDDDDGAQAGSDLPDQPTSTSGTGPDLGALESVGAKAAEGEAVAAAAEEEIAPEDVETSEPEKRKDPKKAEAGRKGAQRAIERNSEIHDYVKSNLPPELQPLWERDGRSFMQKMGSHAGLDPAEVKALKKQGATRYRQVVAERVSEAFLEHAQLSMEGGGGDFAGEVFGLSESRGEAAIAKHEAELVAKERAEAVARGDMDEHGQLTAQGRERAAREEAEFEALDAANAEAEAQHEEGGFFDDLL